jgi:hypothetical protein
MHQVHAILSLRDGGQDVAPRCRWQRDDGRHSRARFAPWVVHESRQVSRSCDPHHAIRSSTGWSDRAAAGPAPVQPAHRRPAIGISHQRSRRDRFGMVGRPRCLPPAHGARLAGMPWLRPRAAILTDRIGLETASSPPVGVISFEVGRPCQPAGTCQPASTARRHRDPAPSVRPARSPSGAVTCATTVAARRSARRLPRDGAMANGGNAAGRSWRVS